MPNTAVHAGLTRAALNLQKTGTGDNKRLIEDYSSWPDFYFSERSAEIAPYMFFPDGIQFHYPPDTPYNELYRYWDMDERGRFRKSRAFVNENFRHVTAGFAFYIGHILECFRKNETEEGKKYLGVLLHMLQDSTFGLHSLEGAGGGDAFLLDRLTGSTPAPSEILAGLRYREDFRMPAYEPQLLGRSRGEMVMKLYAAYCRTSADSRRAAFRYVMNTLENHPGKNGAEEQRMFGNAVTLCADTVHTLFQLAKGETPPAGPCRLDELEPYQFPFGGFAPYRFRSFLRGHAVDRTGKRLPLELDSGIYGHGLSFGTHFDGALLYSIEPGLFREFRCRIGFHTAFPVNGEASVTWINGGKETGCVTLDPGRRSVSAAIPEPGNGFGLKFRSAPGCGVLVLAEPELLP